MTAGALLSERRRAIRMSLAEVAAETRIPLSALRALEADDWQALPAPAYARGFLRAYAAMIGLSGDTLVRLMNQELARVAAQAHAASVAAQRAQREARLEALRVRGAYGVAIGALIAVILGLLFSISPPELEASQGARRAPVSAQPTE